MSLIIHNARVLLPDETFQSVDLLLSDGKISQVSADLSSEAADRTIDAAGLTLPGWPTVTIVGGQMVYENGQVNHQVRGQALRFGP